MDSTYWKSSGESCQDSLEKCHLSAHVYRMSNTQYVLYHAWVKYRYVKLFQSTFIESSQHMLERVMTTRLSRNESSTFCTSTSISFTCSKQYTPHPLPLMTRLAQVESSVILHNSNRCGCIGHGWGIRDIFGIDLREQ